MKKDNKKVKHYEDLTYEERLNDFFDKHSCTIDTNTLSFIIKTEMSDIIYKQHMKSCYTLTSILICLQTFLIVLGLILTIFGINISSITCGISIAILGLVICNNTIHNMTWNKSKQRLKQVEIPIDLLQVRAQTELLNELKNKYDIDVEQYIKDNIESE